MEDMQCKDLTPTEDYDEVCEDPAAIAERKRENDIVNPAYYMQGGVDVLEFASYHTPLDQQIGFARINVLKYVSRYDKKNGMDDLLKARRYLDELIKLEGKR